MRAIETAPVRIKELAEARAEETWAFSRYLKESDLAPEEIDTVFNVYEALKAALGYTEPRDDPDRGETEQNRHETHSRGC